MYAIEDGNMFEESYLEGTRATTIKGSGNTVSIGQKCNLTGLSIQIVGTGNRLIIGERCNLRGSIAIKGNGTTVSIGDHTRIIAAYILASEDCDITIGRWCLFSRKVEIRTSDAHSLIDRATLKRINPAKPVVIGNHVWMGVGALVMKGAVIPDDCVVGANSMVNRAFTQEHVAIAGTPAKIVRENVTWNINRQDQFDSAVLDYWQEKPGLLKRIMQRLAPA